MTDVQVVRFVNWFRVELVCMGCGRVVRTLDAMRKAARAGECDQVRALLVRLRVQVERVAPLFDGFDLPDDWELLRGV